MLDVANVVDGRAPVDLVGDLLEEAVGTHMVSDVPVGAFLSGGIDSSAVVAFMSDIAPPVQTFSVGFDVGGGYNELSDAQRIAQKFGAEHHELTVTHADAIAQIEKLVHPLRRAICRRCGTSDLPRRTLRARARQSGHVRGGKRRAVRRLSPIRARFTREYHAASTGCSAWPDAALVDAMGEAGARFDA